MAGVGYEDRLVVEIAQNAADAARVGGVPGRLLLRCAEDGLLAANTGAALSADGVLALSTLRASSKAGEDVGRFGVGFAAVLAVSDAPQIGSRGTPSVRWSGAQTASLVADVPSLAADVASRAGQVPVLRLPFASDPLDVPAGYDTAVWLPFRNAAAAVRARDLVAALDPSLLLVLSDLAEIVVDGVGVDLRVLRCDWDSDGALLDGRRWVRASASGALPEALLPELRMGELATWSVAAFALADGSALPASTPAVLRAPTPTDEPLSLPAVLSASVPLEPTRRRVVRGPLASYVLARSGEVLASLAALLTQPWALVPIGLAAGDVDAEIRAALARQLPQTPLFAGLLPRECVALDVGEATVPVAELLTDELVGLLPPAWSAPRLRSVLDLLGVRRLDTAGVVDVLGALDRPPSFWRSAYAALAHAADQDALRAVPVPLLDGRTVTGSAGALLPTGSLPPEVAALPLRIVHPDAVHPLLERLGARPATAASLLADPAVREAVLEDESVDSGFVRAVVALAVEAGVGADDEAWLSALLLPSQDGELVPAGDLLWPGGPMQRLIDPSAGLEVLDPPEWLDRDAASRIGVLDRPALLRRDNVLLDEVLADEDDAVGELAGFADWVEIFGAQALEISEFRAVRDLDLVADLPGLLRVLAADPELHAAVVAPVRAGAGTFQSYTAWWLARHPVLDGLLPEECALPGDPLLTGLYDAPPPDLDAGFLRALGVRADLASVLADADGLGDLLDRLGDAERPIPREQARALHAALAVSWSFRLDDAPEPPLAVRAVRPDGVVAAVPSEQAVLVDAPDQLPLVHARGLAVVPAPASSARVLAELLDVALGSELEFEIPRGGVETAVPQVLCDLLAGAPRTYLRHEGGLEGSWRLVGSVLHATDVGLPAGLAWAAGAWSRRHLLAAVAARPDELLRVQLEYDLEELGG